MRKFDFLTSALIMIAFILLPYGAESWQKPTEIKDEALRGPAPLSLTLDQAIGLALGANRSLLASANGLENQELSLVAARSQFDVKISPRSDVGVSDYYKRASAGVTVGKRFDVGVGASVSPGVVWVDDDRSTGEIGLYLEVPLMRGLGKDVTLDAVRSSEFSLRAAERTYYQTQVNTVLDTVSMVYGILKQENLALLYRRQVSRFRGHAATARAKEKVGLATPMDTYRAEIRLKGAEDELARVQEALSDLRDRLKMLLALPLEKPLNVTAPTAYTPVDIEAGKAVNIAFSNRVELEQAADNVSEAERRSSVAKNRQLPELNLALSYSRSTFFNYESREVYPDEDRWAVNLVSRTDWARTAEKAAYSQSLINIRTSKLDLDAKKDEIHRQVRGQIEALKKTKERITIRREQVRQAEGKLSLAKVKFDHHMADNFDVIEAETELQLAESQLTAEKTEYIIGVYRLRAILGTLVERPEGGI